MLGGILKERTPVSEPLIALIAGGLIDPTALGLLDLADIGNQTLILEEAALVTDLPFLRSAHLRGARDGAAVGELAGAGVASCLRWRCSCSGDCPRCWP